jgi:hypothetical protein
MLIIITIINIRVVLSRMSYNELIYMFKNYIAFNVVVHIYSFWC